MRQGAKVKVKYQYILKIAEKNFELAKFLADKTGVIIGFDDITWYFLVKFEDKELSFRRFHLDEVDD